MNTSEEMGDLLATYSAAPARLREAVDALDPAALDRPAAAGEWTPRQIIVHLVDADLVASMRVRQILAEEGPFLPAFHQDAWAAALDYGADAAVVTEALALFALLRSSTARLLTRAPRERWSAWGQHSERGRQTLHDIVATYTRHGEDHLAQLERTAAGI